jgi:hypothetical protein
MAEAVQTDRKAKCLSGTLPNFIVDRSVIHATTLIGSPQSVVCVGAGKSAREFCLPSDDHVAEVVEDD